MHHVAGQLFRERIVEPGVKQSVTLGLEHLLQLLVVLSSVHNALAVAQSLVVGREELSDRGNLGNVKPFGLLLQLWDDPIDKATVDGFLGCHGLVKQQNFGCHALTHHLGEVQGR